MKKILSIITLITIILTSLTITLLTATAAFDRNYDHYVSADRQWIYVMPVKYGKKEIAVIQYKGNETELNIPEKIDGYTVVGIGDFYTAKYGSSGYNLTSKLFADNLAITKVSLPKTIRDIGDYVYQEYEIDDHDYDEGSFLATSYDYEVLFRDNILSPSISKRSIKEYSVNSDNPYLTSVDGVLYNKDKSKLILYPAGKTEKTFAIPQSVTKLREFAFANAQLKKVGNIEKFRTLPTALFIFSDIEELPNIENIDDIPPFAFAYCNNLKTIKIPLRVNYVSGHAFYHCKNLKEVDFGKIIVVGGGAFAQCSSLKTANLPKTCRQIEGYAFSNCHSLETLIIEHAERIGSYAFNKCYNLKTINEHISNVENGNPYNKLSAKRIERHAFKGCKSIKYLYIADSTEIQNEAFIDCTALAEIHFWFDTPDKIHADSFKNTAYVNKHKGGVIYIDDVALCYKKPAKAPTSIWIKKGTTHIASYCLYKIDGLKALYLPSSLKDVEAVNISSCKDLKRVYISGKKTKFNSATCTNKAKYYIKPKAYTVLEHFDNGIYNYTTNWKPDKTKSVKAVGKSKSTAKITWKKQGYVTGYKVYMKTSKNGKWKKVATLKGSNSISYTKKGLSRNKTYYFRVRAYKTVDNTTYHGAYSATDAAKTKSR